MQKILESLHKNLSAKYSSTGTLYVSYKGKKIRISNHEPNYSMQKIRGKADLNIFTHNVEGKEILSKYDIVEKVAEFLNLEIKGATKGAITRFRNKEIKEITERLKYMSIQQSEKDNIQTLFHSKIKEATKGRLKEVRELYYEADKYSDSASNGSKRRKKKVSYFKREFKNRFGIDATNRDVEIALNIKLTSK